RKNNSDDGIEYVKNIVLFDLPLMIFSRKYHRLNLNKNMAYEKRRGKINNAKPQFDWVFDNFDNRYFVDSWKYYTDCCVGECSEYRRIYSRIWIWRNWRVF